MKRSSGPLITPAFSCQHPPTSTGFKQGPVAYFLLSLPLIFLLITGCETLSSRLARNQDVLNSLSFENQALIRQGQIKVGFTPVETYLAWGAPSHKAITESTRGSLETWIYTVVHTETYYRQKRIYNTSLERWEYIDKPYQRHSEYIAKEAIFQDGRVDSFTLYPSAKPYR